jgi:hypothetical protein
MLLALIALHACAALWHFCIARDGTMERMLPWRRRRVASAAGPLAEQQSTPRLS